MQSVVFLHSCTTSYSFLIEEMANVVACALVQSRVDNANSLYTGMSSVNFDKLQLVQNTFVCVVTLVAQRQVVVVT